MEPSRHEMEPSKKSSHVSRKCDAQNGLFPMNLLQSIRKLKLSSSKNIINANYKQNRNWKNILLAIGFSFGVCSFGTYCAQDIDTEMETQNDYRIVQQYEGDRELVRKWQDPNLWGKKQVQLITEDGKMGDISQLSEFIASIPYGEISVVSVIGELRSGKSHFLNTMFFHRGKYIFKEGKQATGLTKGCWLSHSGDVLLLDCEGLLDPSLDGRTAENRKLDLLKIVAISDVVVYLSAGKSINQNDVNLLTELSTKYLKTVSNDMDKLLLLNSDNKVDPKIIERARNAGPSLIIYHRRANDEIDKLSDDQFQNLFNSKLPTYQNGGCFRSILYAETLHVDLARDYNDLFDSPLARTIAHEIRSSYSMRKRKHPNEILEITSKLCDIYSNDAPYIDLARFWYERYTCNTRCIICNSRCREGYNHQICVECRTTCSIEEHHVCNFSHKSHKPCKKHAEYSNVEHMCKLCLDQGNGKRTATIRFLDGTITDYIGLPYLKHMWRGDSYYCKEHGHIGTSHTCIVIPNNTGDIIYDEIIHKWE